MEIIYTIGHSTHPLDQFIDLLKARGVALLADIRTIPKSRHNPQYNSDLLPDSLKEYGIEYRHFPGLGGLRKPRKDSMNTGWKNVAFRGYADYMQTAEFADNLTLLIETAREKTTAIMCAEALPWRCHRSLVADALVARGVTVMHIMSRTSVKRHEITPWAVVRGLAITYPSAD